MAECYGSAPMSETSTVGVVRDRDGVLRVSGVPVREIVERAAVTTPAYVYDLGAISASAKGVVDALGARGLCCYAVKANGAAPIVRAIVAAGCGIDVVSGGELRLALACGARADTIVYSGVAKRDDEIDLALGAGIKAIHAESVEEVERIVARARALGRAGAPVTLRVNPSIEADTHANIATGHDEAKFGVARDDVPRALEAIRASGGAARLVGLSSHVGSMLLDVAPYAAAAGVLAELALATRAQGFALEYLDTGGGFGIAYRDEQRALPGSAFVAAARAELDARGLGDLAMLVEPGRALVAPHGLLVSRVIQTKRSTSGGVSRRWILVDAGMNDLIRPALYQAHHRIEPLELPAGTSLVPWRVAGPVCESSDDFGVHPLPEAPEGLVAIRDAGAYGRSMASTYNTRPIASEVFVEGGAIVAVRRARTADDLVHDELAI